MSEKETKKKRPQVAIPELDEFLQVGAHFGHRTSRWHPAMKDYIYGSRNGVHIIDIVKSMKQLRKALDAIQKAVDHGSVLIVGTKGQAATVVEKVALEKGAFYINRRWPGGLFTNFKMLKQSVEGLVDMEEDLAAGSDTRVKKEELLLEREVQRLNKLYDGIKFMNKLPKLVIVIDSKVESNAIKEAQSVGIPVVALLDTNCDPTGIDYPIPANDDSIKSIRMFMSLFAQAIDGGKEADAVISLRHTHEAKLAKLQKELEHKRAMEAKQKEDELAKLKALRAGKKYAAKQARATSAKTKDGVVRVKQEVKPEDTKAAQKSVEELDVSTRVKNALKDSKIETVAELKGMTTSELKKIKGVGEKAAEEIKEAL